MCQDGHAEGSRHTKVAPISNCFVCTCHLMMSPASKAKALASDEMFHWTCSRIKTHTGGGLEQVDVDCISTTMPSHGWYTRNRKSMIKHGIGERHVSLGPDVGKHTNPRHASLYGLGFEGEDERHTV
eukprot:69581-Pelagomonas_calceolata.AAC.1